LRHILDRTAILVVICWFLSLPLDDILTYPTRLSVLPNLETDAAAYDAFARDLASTGDWSALPAKHPPGWMVVLAGVYHVFGHSYVAGKLVSWIALVVTVGLCGWLAHRVYGRTAAIVAALVCASSPGLRGYVGTLQYEVLTAALFTALLVLTVRAAEAATVRRTIARAALAGVVGGALVLTRETFVLVIPLAAAWLWHRARSAPGHVAPSARGMAAASVLLLVAAGPAVVWSAVQTAQHQRLILISDKAREVFDSGNNPLANGTYNEPLVGIGEPAGMDYIRAHPADALRLAGRRVLYSFGILRDGWNVPHPAAVWIWRATTGAVPLDVIEPVVRGGWLLVVCLIALAMLGRTGLRAWWLLPAAVIAILAVHVATLASYRFAVPLLPVLYVIASGPLARLARALGQASRTPAAAVAFALLAVVTVAAQFRSWPLEVRYNAADLDGIAASNAVDELSGAAVRVADAERGERPVALLPDTYLPRGVVRVAVSLRRTSPDAQDATPVARLTMQPLGAAGCASDVLAVQVPADRFADVALRCELARDSPVTLAVFSLGQVNLAVESIELQWR
jgi:4-amino-4-deoxy-L-arabinose transferase-like glycosyltransferase